MKLFWFFIRSLTKGDFVLQMKGEMELIEKILETEISIFSSIRDGTALMQHMEDFYYITLLEVHSWVELIDVIC